MKPVRKIAILFCLSLWIVSVVNADETSLGDEAFHQAMMDVGTDTRLMCLAAHPDDEDGATLALYRKKHGVKTFAVIATRGEGGQNEIGPELYEELGVIRTHEMMRAARMTGAELRFLNLPEFGYSKTAEETMALWGRDEALRLLVGVIREVRPDVIITHHGRAKDHGHHQVIGGLLMEAFDAAVDASVFPEQVEAGLPPWQASRLYIRTWDQGLDSVVVDISRLHEVSGKTYAEIAAEALREHASQGMGYFITRYLTGRPKVYYDLVKEAPQDHSTTTEVEARGALFAGLNDRVAPEFRALSDSATSRAELLNQAPALLQGRTDDLGHRPWEPLNRAVCVAAGLRLAATVDDGVATHGQTVKIRLQLTDFGDPNAESVTFSVLPAAWFGADAPHWLEARLGEDQMAEAELPIAVPGNAPITVPYAAHLFDAHFLRPPIDALASVRCGETHVVLRQPVQVDVAPAVGVDFLDGPYLVRWRTDATAQFDVLLTNNLPGTTTGTIVMSVSSGLQLDERAVPFELRGEGHQRVVPVKAEVKREVMPNDLYLSAMLEGEWTPHHAKVRVMDLKVPEGVHVGVVQSYDDTFVKTLGKMGVPHAALGIADFTPGRLDRFTTVLVDMRAYLVRDDLIANNQALLEYVERGGNVIVMYQKTFEWKEEYAPYPIHVSRNRVTVEEAPVEILAPDHPVFTRPNAITHQDWDGWIQERGLYFPDTWDERYTPLVACVDPGEDIPPGSWLVARYGDGTYMYTALGWYRQLRELHPGALRMFANMLAVGAASEPTATAEPGAAP